jgi:hypothetical protein
MALYYDLPVFQEVYRLVLLIFRCTKDFPREYKFTLGQDMRRDTIVLVRNLYRANKSTVKQPHLEQFLDDFELLKFQVRLCRDLGVLGVAMQAEIALLMEGIGKQITGWRNATR